MNVRQLFRRPERDDSATETSTVLKVLAGMAAKGEIKGLALCYRDRNGADHTVLAGAYKAQPAEAVNAAMRLSWKLTQAQDEAHGPPSQ
jgi:hypothetical protein